MATPPAAGHRADALVEQARRLRIHGVDALQVLAGSQTGARMSPLSLAVLIEQQAGLETILNVTCRDHSLLGLQSDLLGAHALGIRNLLITTGQPSRLGDYQDATTVYDVDSIGLTNVVTRLNQGFDIGGKSLGAPTGFHIGVAVNPSALNGDEESRRFRFKLEAGAEFVVLRPVFDPNDIEDFLKRNAHDGVPVIGCVRPIESVRQAEFLANEVPGVRVPERYLARMQDAERDGRAADEGVTIAAEIAQTLRPLVQGLQIWAPPGRLDTVVPVLDAMAAPRRA